MPTRVQAAYSGRAAEYVDKLGAIESVHPSDRALIAAWAADIDGPILDAGCGPGHWTAYLTERGSDARGLDQVPEFIEHARATCPNVSFELGSFDQLPDARASLGGILAWYSLIHHDPSRIRIALQEFARVLRPDASLLLGFFIGADLEPFDHTVVTAYRWPPELLAIELNAAGFEVIETHTRAGRDPRPRPHGAIIARRVPAQHARRSARDGLRS